MEKITQQKIKKICQVIAEKFKPEKIILFGSFAWGRPTFDSDVDLLIIKKTKKDFIQTQMKVRRIINGELPVDILVKTPAELEKRLRLRDFFFEDVIKKGKVIYEKK